MSAKCVYQVDLKVNDYKWSGAECIDVQDGVAIAHVTGKQNTYVLRCSLPHSVNGDGVGVRVFLGGWKSIDYVAVGYTRKFSYQHIKVKNIRQDAWVDVVFTHADIIWQLQNGFGETAKANISDIKVFIKGDPGDAVVKLRQLQVLISEDISIPPQAPLNGAVVNVLTMHFRRALRDYTFAASQYMSTGQCPVPGKQLLPWALDAAKPQGLESVNSYCSSWHGMHLVVSLILHAEDTESIAPLMAARAWVEQWLDYSYFKPDADQKYTWYDHGTAERLMAMLLLWHKTAELGFDYRFANRLWRAIITHITLLHSEAFYAYHQPIRYHNHAWFQDAALIAAALAFPEYQGAEDWLDNGISRFEDQLEHLIVRDGGFAIFVENSIGYHHGVQRLAEVVGALVVISGRETEIPAVAKELVAWSDFLRYPDGRVPAQGDTFRLPPRTGTDIRPGKPWLEPSCTVLPEAGYAVVKGNQDGKPWMLCLFNTSLSKTHKHEDNLSITFWFDGVEWLIDPSFYSHEYQQPIAAYLRSAQAHNNIFIRDACYSKELGVANLEGRCDSGKFLITGSHRAYGDLVTSRVISGHLNKLELTVVDGLTFKAPFASTNARLAFHFAEDVQVDTLPNRYRLSHPERDTSLLLRVGTRHDQLQQDDRSPAIVSFGVGSMAGQGFQQQVPTVTLEVALQDLSRFSWSIAICDDSSELRA